MLYNLAVLFATLVAMEGVGTLAHKYVMHGWGWWLHRSHHEPHLGVLETNDLYLVALALIAAGLVALGKAGYAPLQWVGAGVAGYGLAYVVAHDGFFHRHWPRAPKPVNRYLKRLHRAHRLHHAVKGRKGSVSFGFFYAPPLRVLKGQLKRRRLLAANPSPQLDPPTPNAVECAPSTPATFPKVVKPVPRACQQA